MNRGEYEEQRGKQIDRLHRTLPEKCWAIIVKFRTKRRDGLAAAPNLSVVIVLTPTTTVDGRIHQPSSCDALYSSSQRNATPYEYPYSEIMPHTHIVRNNP